MKTGNATHFIEQYNPVDTKDTKCFFTPALEIRELDHSLNFTKGNLMFIKTVAIFLITLKNKKSNG